MEVCERDGVREVYLSPQDHRIAVKLAGAVPAAAACAWTFDDGETPAQQTSGPCAETVTLRVRYGHLGARGRPASVHGRPGSDRREDWRTG